MAKRVILAVAGAGKTYHICHTLDPQKSNLILAYTNENIHNIQKELCNAYGNVPKATTVMTFDSFVYNNMILPYEPSIGEFFNEPDFKSCGVCTVEPPQRMNNGVFNPKYITKNKLRHYITKRNQYYCATLSELVLNVKKTSFSLVNLVANRLNLFYDYVLIDEFQDFREYDYELIVELSKKLNNVLLVGDYYQHSVSATNNSGKPFKRKNVEVGYDEFISAIKKEGFSVDIDTLKKSRRCSFQVCNYISKKLGINITSYDDHEGNIIWADSFAREVLENDKILKLVYNDSAYYIFTSMNWSYSKGDTFDAVCVILTDKFDSIDDDTFSVKVVSNLTVNKLYVAMTRSSGDLYLIKSSTFKKIKNLYAITKNG